MFKPPSFSDLLQQSQHDSLGISLRQSGETTRIGKLKRREAPPLHAFSLSGSLRSTCYFFERYIRSHRTSVCINSAKEMIDRSAAMRFGHVCPSCLRPYWLNPFTVDFALTPHTDRMSSVRPYKAFPMRSRNDARPSPKGRGKRSGAAVGALEAAAEHEMACNAPESSKSPVRPAAEPGMKKAAFPFGKAALSFRRPLRGRGVRNEEAIRASSHGSHPRAASGPCRP